MPNEMISGDILRTYPKLRAERRLKRLQEELGVSAKFVSAWAGITPSTLSAALRGTASIDNDVMSQLLDDLDFLVQLKDAAAPLCLPLENVVECKALYTAIRDAGVTPEDLRQAVLSVWEKRQ